mgnify:FL=1
MALRVDHVDELLDVDEADIDPMVGPLAQSDAVVGTLHLEGELVLIHDLSSFLTAAEADALARALAATSDPPPP